VDPSEKDEDREIVMKSKIIDHRLQTAGSPASKLEVLDDADRKWEMERNWVCDWILRGRSASKFP
jgi:hypothetical protein